MKKLLVVVNQMNLTYYIILWYPVCSIQHALKKPLNHE